MNDYNVPIIEPTIDYTKVPSINQKRTISFINQFIIHMVTFLNTFALSCEEKLFEFENKLQRVEAALEILESRLSSIPGLKIEGNHQTPDVEKSTEETTEAPVECTADDSQTDEKETRNGDQAISAENNKPEEQSVQKDPRYEKYFKMIHFGVPRAAVKLKMEQEGLNPSVLDDPQASVPKETSSSTVPDPDDSQSKS